MLDIQTLIPSLLKRVAKLETGDYLEVCSYKRDRCLRLIRLDGVQIRVEEDGFEQHGFELPEGELKRLLKTLVKREFPRSNKVRVYEMGPWDPHRAGRVDRKRI